MKLHRTISRCSVLVLGSLWLGACATTPPAVSPTTSSLGPDAPAPVFTLAAAMAAQQPEKDAIASRIAKVTVYSDRAMVTRTARATISKEPATYRFHHLPGWIDEGALRVEASAGTILDVRTERRFLARASDSGFQKAELDHKVLQNKLGTLEDELNILDEQRRHIDSIEAFSLDKLSTDTVTRDIKVSSYRDTVQFISEALRENAATRRRVQLEIDKLSPDVQASSRNLEELRQLTHLEETSVIVTLQGADSTQADISVTYATPGATWEPSHEIRLDGANPNQAQLASYAVVTQTTGEDWTQAHIAFSTQSASDPERIPKLEMLALGETHERKATMVRKENTFARAQEAFKSQNMQWNRMNNAPRSKGAEIERFEKSYAVNLAYFEKIQSKTVEIFQGLQQRGTNVHFVSSTPVTIRSNGQPVRVKIGSNNMGVRPRIIAAPEDSLNAALTLQMTNPTSQPLLPGSVARYREGAFLGMTDIDHVAPGEDFSLFFSVEDRVKLSRTLDRKQSSLVKQSRNRLQLAYITTAKNLSDKVQDVVIAERIPVSENSDIAVNRVVLSPAAKPDSEGIVRWTLQLKPGEQRELRVAYQIEYPPSLILDVKRRRSTSVAPEAYDGDGPEDAMPSPAAAEPPAPRGNQKKRDITDQIYDMEQML